MHPYNKLYNEDTHMHAASSHQLPEISAATVRYLEHAWEYCTYSIKWSAGNTTLEHK